MVFPATEPADEQVLSEDEKLGLQQWCMHHVVAQSACLFIIYMLRSVQLLHYFNQALAFPSGSSSGNQQEPDRAQYTAAFPYFLSPRSIEMKSQLLL